MKKSKLGFLTLALVLLGALNWGLVGAFDFDAVKALLGREMASVAYVLVGLAALMHVGRRDFYLPFLGKTVFPCAPLEESFPADFDTVAEVRTGVPNANVVFWASDESDTITDDPWTAYGQHTNSGVARTDETGLAVLRVRKPGLYRVPWKGHKGPLPSHVHYRVCKKPGMLGAVKTVNVTD